ncbi:MAG: SH3 domain-containing protein [Bacteroidota bacterium]
MLRTLACACFLFFTVLSFGQKTFPPIDDSRKDAALAEFVEKLKIVAAKHDTAALRAMLDANVQTSWDGDNTIAGFWNSWALGQSDSSMLWPILSRVLSLGGAFNKDEKADSRFAFVFPYVCTLSLEDPDWYTSTGVITGKDVNFRDRPAMNAPIIGKLSYDVIQFALNAEGLFITSGQNVIGEPEWYCIEKGGTRGWVFWQYIYAPIDWRLYLAKIDEKWKITCLIAGD